MSELPRGCLALSAALLALAPAASVAGPWQTALELGLEGDTNVTRVETGDPSGAEPVAAPLFRALFALGRGGEVGEHLRWTGRVRLGARGVAGGAVASENIITAAAEVAVERDGPSGSTLVARASHYDARALQAGPERRDFATSGVDVGLRLPPDADRHAELDVGLRRLVFRRDGSFDWSGPLLAIELGDQVWRCHDDRAIDLTGRYQVERRRYAGLAFTRVACPGGAADVCVRPTAEQRADLRHTLEAELLYTGDQVLSARYRLTVNTVLPV